LPKIWGNTRHGYRTALLVLWLDAGCTTPPPEITTRAIRAHWLPACPPERGTGQLDVDALGDFDPSTNTHAVVDFQEPGSPLDIPDSTRAVVLDADTGFGLFRGASSMPEVGDIPVSLWPAAATCTLHAQGAPNLDDVEGVAVGYAPAASVMLFSGGAAHPADAFVYDLSNGIEAAIPSARGPRAPRIGATVTPFGSKLLVAGGSDPDAGPRADADVFDPVTRRFEVDQIALEHARADHAAVVLASNETLLVGGSDANGTLLRGLEVVSPLTKIYRVSGLAALTVARARPQALRLSDDRILVAGGVAADGTPVDALEWLAADASRIEQQSSLESDAGVAPVVDRAFVPMPGGSALAVGGCRLSQITSDGACVPCAEDTGKGPRTGCVAREVIWITHNGIPDVVPSALDVAMSRTLLVAGTEGRPWLVGSTPNGPQLLRFDPWLGHFSAPDDAPPAPLDGFPTTVTQNFEARFFSIEPGLFLWLSRPADPATTEPPGLYGFRHDTKGQYSATIVPLMLNDQEGVALDRWDVGKWLDPTTNEVRLDASGNTLVVADTTFQDVGVAVEVSDGAPPMVLLGHRAYGDVSCPWPGPVPDQGYVARLRRVGSQVSLELSGKSVTCPGPEGRVSIWLKSAGPSATVRSIAITRSP